jgi:hypothetical protein
MGRDRHSKLAYLCLDILYYPVIDHQRNKEFSLWILIID